MTNLGPKPGRFDRISIFQVHWKDLNHTRDGGYPNSALTIWRRLWKQQLCSVHLEFPESFLLLLLVCFVPRIGWRTQLSQFFLKCLNRPWHSRTDVSTILKAIPQAPPYPGPYGYFQHPPYPRPQPSYDYESYPPPGNASACRGNCVTNGQFNSLESKVDQDLPAVHGGHQGQAPGLAIPRKAPIDDRMSLGSEAWCWVGSI